MSGDSRCIGVFDSGIGGLTVVRELRRRLPQERIVYFGDTARVPYGIKSTQTVTRFAREICDFLLRFDPKMIVVACNTVSAVALTELQSILPVPLVGVVDPGAQQAVLMSRGRTIGVIATEATIQSEAYRRAIGKYDPHARVVQKACPLFVPLVEEGRRGDDPITQAVVRDYLGTLMALDPSVLVLGCTHYPLLKDAIREFIGPAVSLVDSGEQTAAAVIARLGTDGTSDDEARRGDLTCYVSDNPQRFRELGQRFLGHPITDVTWVSHDQLLAADAKSAAVVA